MRVKKVAGVKSADDTESDFVALERADIKDGLHVIVHTKGAAAIHLDEFLNA
jgi:hypothetical protein